MERLEFFDSYVRIGPGLEVVWSGLEANRRPLDGRSTTGGSVLEEMDALGVREAMVQHVLSYQYDAAYGNRLLLEETAGRPRLHPVFMLYPPSTGEYGDVAEVAKLLRRHRVEGVLLYGGAFRFRGGGGFPADDWNLGELYDLLEEMRMPVFARPEVDLRWEGVHAVMTAHPGLRLVLREVDLAADRSLYALAEAFPGLCVGTENYKGLFALEEFTRRFGSERLVFGSGYPVQSLGGSMAAVLMADLDRKDKENIAGGNLARLIGGIRHG